MPTASMSVSRPPKGSQVWQYTAHMLPSVMPAWQGVGAGRAGGWDGFGARAGAELASCLLTAPAPRAALFRRRVRAQAAGIAPAAQQQHPPLETRPPYS